MKRTIAICAAMAGLLFAGFFAVAQAPRADLALSIASSDSWPVYAKVRLNSEVKFDRWNSGGVAQGEVFASSTILTDMPASEIGYLHVDLVWSEYHTGASYTAEAVLPFDAFEVSHGTGGARVTIAYGPFGRYSLWSPSPEMRRMDPLDPDTRIAVQRAPALVKLQLVHAGCGTRAPDEEARFAQFLRTGPDHAERHAISPAIADATAARLAPCTPDDAVAF